jgi:hypothetical protein
MFEIFFAKKQEVSKISGLASIALSIYTAFYFAL